MSQNREQIHQYYRAQLAIVTIAIVPTNLDNPFSFNSF